MICITPFKEIIGGDESIYDYVEEGYTVPDKVIAYLRIANLYIVSPGIYEHPFKKGINLRGPFSYTDDKYYWNSDTWKYVIKYHVRLPEDFIEHVMSDKGTEFIEKQIAASDEWSDVVKEWNKENEGYRCFFSDELTDKKLEEF